jgi:hypothetical protein
MDKHCHVVFLLQLACVYADNLTAVSCVALANEPKDEPVVAYAVFDPLEIARI